MKLEEKRTGPQKKKKNSTKNTAESSAGDFSFSVSSAKKENWVILKITAQGPAFSPSSPFLYGRAIGQSCEQLHKVQQKVDFFPPPPLNNLPSCSAAMNTNRVILVCFQRLRMVFRGSAKHFFLKLEVLQIVRLCDSEVWGETP